MKLVVKILIVIGVVFLLLLSVVFMFFSGTFYYLNEKKHINIKEAEIIKNKDSDSNFVVLDYYIKDDTIYYYSKYNNWFSKKAYIYKANLNNEGFIRNSQTLSIVSSKIIDWEKK